MLRRAPADHEWKFETVFFLYDCHQIYSAEQVVPKLRGV